VRFKAIELARGLVPGDVSFNVNHDLQPREVEDDGELATARVEGAAGKHGVGQATVP